MARKQYTIPAHGVVEHNFLASEATRQIEAQTPVKDGIETLENGMILFIDRKNNEIVKEEVSCPYLMHPVHSVYLSFLFHLSWKPASFPVLIWYLPS